MRLKDRRDSVMGTQPSTSLSDLNSTRFVTISVDDGDPRDFRTAELLDKYGLKATFYIPSRNPERPVMAESQIGRAHV